MTVISSETILPPWYVRGAPDSPQEWITRLKPQLAEQSTYARSYGDYYAGSQPLKFAQQVWRQNFAMLFPNFAMNFCRLIVDSVAERMTVEGFRMGDAPDADKDARVIWQRNKMDAQSTLAHVEALSGGIVYGLVWKVDGKASITIESPHECFVELDPADSRNRLAGLKHYTDKDGSFVYELWLPETWYRFRSRTRDGQLDSPEEVARNPLGVVPLIPIVPQPGLAQPATSEIVAVAPMQDTLNKIIADMLVASEFAAFPQRYATGLELEEDETQPGQPKIPFRVGIDRMLSNPDPEGKFGAFPAADLTNYVNAAQMLVQQMAAVSRVPFHYFLLNGGQAPSGEAIQSAEAGLIAVVRTRSIHVGEAWEEIMRLALQAEGGPADEEKTTETMWAEPAYRSEAVVVDAAVKKDGLGVPKEQLYADIGYSQAEIARFRSMRAKDQLDARLNAARFGIPTQPAAPGQSEGQPGTGAVGPAPRQPGQPAPAPVTQPGAAGG